MLRLSAVLSLVLCLPASAQADAEPQDAFATAGTAESAAPAPRGPEGDYDVDAAPAYYVTARDVALRQAPAEVSPAQALLQPRDGVRVLAEDGAPADGFAFGWRLVQAGDRRGYVRASELSNLWIRVDKSDRMVYVYRGSELVRELPADVSVNPEDKVRRSDRGESDHYRIPEGTFFVTRLNDRSSYYRAFVISYPGPVHAMRGLRSGLITQAQYETIVRADQDGVEPPMGTRLGGLIEIHGSGSGRQRAWTRGCVALRNVHMDELWDVVEVGTPVVIEP